MKRHILTLALFSIASMAIAQSARNASQLYQEAKEQDEANRYGIALDLYLKADSAFVAEGLIDTPEYAQSLHNTGRAYFNTDDAQTGRDFTLKAAKLRERLFGKESKEYVTSLNNYAISYFMTGDLHDALKHQTEVMEICRRMDPPHPDEGMYLINLGRIYHALGKDDEAVSLMEEAMPKVEKFGTNYEYILNFLGMVYMDRNDNANINRILALSDEHNRHELEKECDNPKCHLDRATYYMATGDQARAKDEYMAVLSMSLTEGQKAEVYGQYAQFLYSSLRDFAQAAAYYEMAAEAAEKDGGVSEKSVSLLRQAGLFYFVGKQYDKSIAAHSEVIAATDAHGYSESLKSSSLQGLGNAYSAKKDYGSAIDAFTRWIEHLEANGHKEEPNYAKAYERRASAEKFKGDYDASLMDYDEAIELYDRLGMHDEKEQAQNGKSRCLFYARREVGDIEESEAARKQREEKIRNTLRESLNSLEQSGGYMGKLSNAQTLATIAGCYAQLEDYPNAIKYYSLYIPAVREAIAEDFLLKSSKERELTWKQELSTISELNSLLPSLPLNQELYSTLSGLIYEGQLLSKGILLSSAVEFDKVLERYGTPDMKAKYITIKENTEKIAQMKAAQKPLEDILTLSRKTDALQLSLARESAEYADFMKYLRVSSADIVNALGDKAAAIEFVTIDTGFLPDNDLFAAVIISKEYPAGLAIPVAEIRDIKAIIADEDRFSNDAYGEGIWRRILNAIGGKKKIYFSPDGLLNNVGIEYLQVGGAPLSEQIDLTRLSSTREIVREHKRAPLQYASLFGDIDYLEEGTEASDKGEYSPSTASAKRGSIGFAPLDNTRREVDEITSLLKSHTKKTFEYTGAEASKAEFLSQDKIRPLGLLHIATHGKYIDDSKSADAEAMDKSILAFAGANLYTGLKDNDGVATAAEISRMSLHDCELVVLSACESGLGKLGSDGVFGLQRGFKNAGVKSLLVSLNEVSDASTADMMISFYTNLLSREGMSKREALRTAQKEIRTKYPDDDTWASFILIDSFD